jgi:hypothetical protein
MGKFLTPLNTWKRKMKGGGGGTTRTTFPSCDVYVRCQQHASENINHGNNDLTCSTNKCARWEMAYATHRLEKKNEAGAEKRQRPRWCDVK